MGEEKSKKNEKSEKVFIGEKTIMAYLPIVYTTYTRFKKVIVEARGRNISKAIVIAIRSTKFYSLKINDVKISTEELESKVEGQEGGILKEISKIEISLE